LEELYYRTQLTESCPKVIDPALNTVPYIFILNAHCQAISNGRGPLDLDTVCEKIENFLETFDGRQARYLGKELSYLIDALRQITRVSGQVQSKI
jgi:COP9 signalosome complex subunit 3